MGNPVTTGWQELATVAEQQDLGRLARQRRWGLALLLVAWLHLFAFGLCYYLTIVRNYHESSGYLAIWVAELLGMAVLFRLCGGPRPPHLPVQPLERFIARVWISYFLLAFNLGSMNTLRGHAMFELFPAMASLGSFAFLVMTFAVHRDFFGAVVILFASGLLMAAYLSHAYLIFALAWWLILNRIGLRLWDIGSRQRHGNPNPKCPNNAVGFERHPVWGLGSESPATKGFK